MPRAIIIGAGVAGTVSAMALQKAGYEPTVYEAYEHSAGLGQGVFLTLAVNGLDALAAIDAAEAVKALGFATGKIRFSSSTGKALGEMPIGPTLPDGTVTRSIRRAELYSTLYALAVERGVSIEHGKRLTSVDRGEGGVRATFADGSRADGDLLIGADGLRSTVRGLIDPNAPRPRYTGMGNVGGFARVASLRSDGGDYRMMWGRRCFFGYTVSPDGETWWFANPPSRTELTARRIERTTQAQLKAQLVGLLRDDGGPAREIVEATDGEILLTNQYDIPRVPVWQRDRAVLIGDAAHAVSPSTGQGASLACEDAVILAQCLRDLPALDAALAEYERRRRPRVARVVAWGAKMGGTKTAGPLTRRLRDLALPLILARGSTPAALQRMSWMFDHHIEWDGARVAA
jgi:FAD-dependent urate hydroxylase